MFSKAQNLKPLKTQTKCDNFPAKRKYNAQQSAQTYLEKGYF